MPQGHSLDSIKEYFFALKQEANPAEYLKDAPKELLKEVMKAIPSWILEASQKNIPSAITAVCEFAESGLLTEADYAPLKKSKGKKKSFEETVLNQGE